jgi:hypothetical protein
MYLTDLTGTPAPPDPGAAPGAGDRDLCALLEEAWSSRTPEVRVWGDALIDWLTSFPGGPAFVKRLLEYCNLFEHHDPEVRDRVRRGYSRAVAHHLQAIANYLGPMVQLPPTFLLGHLRWIHGVLALEIKGPGLAGDPELEIDLRLPARALLEDRTGRSLPDLVKALRETAQEILESTR